MTRIDTSPHEAGTSPSAVVPATWLPGVDVVAFGGDYNPEQWPREVWDEDIRLMIEAKVNLVTIGVFSWALLEPREGEFDFGWLDEVIERLHSAGISVDLATPTASPPAWFWSSYPEARPVTREGVRLGFGSRGMASPSSPEYAAATTRIVTALAQRYGRHPAVKLWHVHNEYGAPVSQSYDEYSVVAFREWLIERYGRIEQLNAAWGTAFWGQHYETWDEIDAPRQAASVVNPSQRLDFARFTNVALLRCYLRERDIIRRHSPGIPITTNFMATSCPSVDYWTWAPEVDIVSNDHYLAAQRTDSHVMLSMAADMTRSLAGDRPWLLMEHSTSAVNWQERNIAKRPNELARNSFAHWGRGADGILFFQWRASRSGAEKFHSAMVPHAGPDSRIFREVEALGSDLGRLRAAMGTRVVARAAILWDWNSLWALGLEWRPSIDLDFHRQVESYYCWLWNEGVTVDFAHPESDLEGYDLVIAPNLYVATELASRRVRDFVTNGGTLIAAYFAGIVGESDNILPGPVPGGLHDVLGLQVDEFLPLRKQESVGLSDGSRGLYWAEEITTTTAETVLSYADGPAAKSPAVTRNRLGDGTAWYVSTDLDALQLGAVLKGALDESGVRPSAPATPGVEIVVRERGGEAYTTYLNHSDGDFWATGGGVEVLTGEESTDGFTIPAGRARVVYRTSE
ncbi:MAG TPA: beta-galactosidase [Galbitalea sp.]|jgi:beta-galactosidase|nr:beta-galactosidase [Galbitalea sp.]